MPSFSSKLQLSSTAQSNNIVLADVDRIKGAFKTYVSASTMNATSVNYFSDGQIVYVEDSGSLFQATVTPADPPNSFVDTVTFKPFSYVTGSFVSASFDGTNTLTLFGQELSGSEQISMSVDLSALTGSGGGGGSGDITAVTAGSGILGGGASGDVVIGVDSGSLAGLGLTTGSGNIGLDTGSTHFQGGVQSSDLDGSEF
tara:strand:+ start:569 stop:1168 length:600 start_codon:yes stop_codon:yes gene_type:complete